MKTSRFLCVLRRLKPTPKPSSDGGYTQANLNMITPKRISRRQKYVQNRYSLTRYKPQIMLRTTKGYDIGGKRQMRDGMTRHSERDGTERHGTERDELEPAISFSVDAKRIIIIKRKENEKKSDAGKQFNGGTGEDEKRKAQKKGKRNTNGAMAGRNGTGVETGRWQEGFSVSEPCYRRVDIDCLPCTLLRYNTRYTPALLTGRTQGPPPLQIHPYKHMHTHITCNQYMYAHIRYMHALAAVRFT